jgi:hypothetical protein
MITEETRLVSYIKTLSEQATARHKQVQIALFSLGKPSSAQEVATEMKRLNYCLRDDRNKSAPRINELIKTGVLEEVGTTFDFDSQREVTTFWFKKLENKNN